jgi:4-hydroxy-tetrahydrodipicolinate synthase
MPMSDVDAFPALRGMIAPAVTPFEADEIRWDLFRADLRVLLAAGVDGIGVAGSTGEGAALDDAEIASLVQAAKDEVDGGLPIIAGIIRNSTRQAVSAARAAAAAGADALLVTPVFYSGATPDDNARYYQAVSDAVDLPILVYNVSPTNVIEPEIMRRLSEIERVIGIKQVVAEGVAAMVAACGDGARVFGASDAMLYGTYTAGAVGAFSALITVAPDACVQQWRAYVAGDQATAAEIGQRLAPIALAYASRPFTSKVKAFIELQGRAVGHCRAPVSDVTAEERQAYRRLLERAALLPASAGD